MAFDFSAYLPPPPGQTAQPTPAPQAAAPAQTMGALPAGITQADIPQMQYLMNSPILNDPATQMNTDSEGNNLGLFSALDPDAYKTAEDQWNEQQKLINAGMLNAPTQVGGGDGSTPQTISGGYGSAVPDAIAHRDGTASQSSAANQNNQLVYSGNINDTSGSANNSDQKLINPAATLTDPNWGTYTSQGNIDQSHGALSDTFWKVAPLIPAAIATIMTGGAGAAMFGALPESSANAAISAGALAGDQTAGALGGAFNGSTATAGDALSGLPSSITNALPNVVKSGISTLGNGGDIKSGLIGAATGLGGAALGGLTGFDFSKYLPLVNAGIGLANGGSFDFSKYIPMGLQQIAKGMG